MDVDGIAGEIGSTIESLCEGMDGLKQKFTPEMLTTDKEPTANASSSIGKYIDSAGNVKNEIETAKGQVHEADSVPLDTTLKK